MRYIFFYKQLDFFYFSLEWFGTFSKMGAHDVQTPKKLPTDATMTASTVKYGSRFKK